MEGAGSRRPFFMYDPRMRYVRRVLGALGILALALWVGAVAVLWLGETRVVFRHQWTQSWAPIDPGAYTAVTLDTPDGVRLEGVALEGMADGRDDRDYWILFFNGAAHSIHRRQQRQQLEQLHGLGYKVLAFDYRGFGRSGGRPSEPGLYTDAITAYRYLTTVRRVPPRRVILAGRSLGSAVAVEVATRVPVAGLVLLSAIDSIPSMGWRLYPWAPVRLLASNQFDSLSKMASVRMPVVVVHARGDRFVPLQVGRSLYERAAGPKVMLETAGGHNSAGFTPLDELAEALATFWPPAPASL